MKADILTDAVVPLVNTIVQRILKKLEAMNEKCVYKLHLLK